MLVFYMQSLNTEVEICLTLLSTGAFYNTPRYEE